MKRIMFNAPSLCGDEHIFIERALLKSSAGMPYSATNALETELERELNNYAVCTASGYTAIELALKTLGFKYGDTVFTNSFAHPKCACACANLGAKLVFIDCDTNAPLSFNALSRAVKSTEGGRFVLACDSYGTPCDFDKINALCHSCDIPVIEYAAEGLGGKVNDKAVGTLADIGIISFEYNKLIGGGGGAVLSADSGRISRAKTLSASGRDKSCDYYSITETGMFCRMDDALAALILSQLPDLTNRAFQKQRIHRAYKSGDCDYFSIVAVPDSAAPLCPILAISDGAITVKDVETHLYDCAILSRPVYKPIHCMPAFDSYMYFPHEENLSLCSNAFSNQLALPATKLSESKIAYIIDRIIELF